MPENEDLKVKLAQILFQEQGKLKEAKECLDNVFQLNPDNNEALYIYAKILIKEKDYKKAEEMNQKAIDNQKKNGEPIKAGSYFHLGQS